MADETFDREFWEGRWAQALREHPDQVAVRPPMRTSSPRSDMFVPGSPRGLWQGAGGDMARNVGMAGHRRRLLRDRHRTRPRHRRRPSVPTSPNASNGLPAISGDWGAAAPALRPGQLFVRARRRIRRRDGESARFRGRSRWDAVSRRSPPGDPATGEPTPAAGQRQVTVADAVRRSRLVLSGTSSWPRSGTCAGGTGADAVVRVVLARGR